ncbi:hypothetical protein GCM10007868_09070 [Gluconobacter frateurii]|uniref:Uncharacterized protein n=1 Tax=Gluconobacter frateurii NRIC 0228 TaxID=1307946 RepID=A0ABQ0QCS1_9PROT|nr:hypothetical protein AA0228_1974 [Gluconobacter frateurii NRIC 0228]GLP89832.1 hypothetical protein GCM10007868_09070 [Gluconobacter frateurii]
MQNQHAKKHEHGSTHATQSGQTWQTKLFEICQKSLHLKPQLIEANLSSDLSGNSTLPIHMRVTLNAAITDEHCV